MVIEIDGTAKPQDQLQQIKVLDLFAGPGGLGEGFASLECHGQQPFKIALSIEKDKTAFKTLQLRSFFRQFTKGNVPNEYYQYLRGEISRRSLFRRFQTEYHRAKQEAWCLTLGSKRVAPQAVDKRIQVALGGTKNWILIGGPPCQAYSLIGRVKIKSESKKKQKDFDKDHRHFLYREYLKIIAIHKPPVFVMENVPGILSSKINGTNTFERIIGDLRNPDKAVSALNGRSTQNSGQSLSYHIYSLVRSADNGIELQPTDYIIKAENYGIPQARHRVILLGIRTDIQSKPRQLTKSDLPVPMWDAISDLVKIRSRLSKEPDSNDAWKSVLQSIPHCQWFADPNLEESLKNRLKIASESNDSPINTGAEFLAGTIPGNLLPEWFCDQRIQGQCNHSARSHIREDLHRYFFASCFAETYGRSPKISDFPKGLRPRHANIERAVEESMFSDRFRVQVRCRPSTTITSHISKDGHYYIHPDALQCRSLTVREVARLQTFPDNYFFEGPRTEQYHQIGNAVPPLLAKQIAAVVYPLFAECENR